MTRKINTSSKLNKIVYFDDGSVTDYIQIVEGGVLTKTVELLSNKTNSGTGETKAKASAGIGDLFRGLLGFGANIDVETGIGATFQNETLVKNILQNTILTDFLDLIQKNPATVEVLEKINLRIIKDSLTYIILVSPYMKMLKDGSLKLDSELDFSLDMIKMDDAIKLAKGYFEFEGILENKASIILRFNINSFKNNYKISDLLKMNLTVYAVPVGKTKRSNISIVSEMNAFKSDSSVDNSDNPVYGEECHNVDSPEDELKVYDVLLAGV